MTKTKAIKYIEASEKIIYKIRYILEFVFSLITCVGIFKLVTIKNYMGYFDKKYLALTVIYAILTLACIIYCCYKDKKIIEKMFLTFIIPIGIMYIAFMIPSHVPDELPHMIKAYEVSQGILMTPIEKDRNFTY